MFKFYVTDLNQVAEEHRQFYVADGKGFRLNVEGAVSREKLDEFRTNNISLQQKVTALEGDLKTFEGIDPSKWEEYKTKAEAFKGDKDIDQIVAQRTQSAMQAANDKMKALETQVADITGKYTNTVIGSKVRDAAARVGALPGAIDDIIARGNGVFSIVNDQVVIMKDNQVVYGQDGVTPMSPLEWTVGLSKDAPHLFGENKGGGGGNGPTFGGKSPDKMTPLEMIQNGLNQQ